MCFVCANLSIYDYNNKILTHSLSCKDANVTQRMSLCVIYIILFVKL